jgi:hypothetical protein
MKAMPTSGTHPLWRLALLAISSAAFGCALPARVATMDRAFGVPYHEVDWNIGQAAKGPIRAVLDDGHHVVVFGDHAATIFAEGALVGTEPHDSSWVGAARVPAPDRSGDWLLGIDRLGALYRLRAGRTFEGVSARFGLLGTAVRAASKAGSTEAIFAVDGGFVFSDGEHVRRYAVEGRNLSVASVASVAGGENTAILVGSGKVTVLRTSPFQATTLEMRAVGSAVDARGRVAILAERGLYLSDGKSTDGGATLVYEGSHLHGLTSAANLLYFADGTQLLVLDGSEVHKAEQALVSEDAELVGSPTGDVWAIAASGTLKRFSAGAKTKSAPSSSAISYSRDVAPLVRRDCVPCHAEGGTTGVVLTNEADFRARRDLVRQRVLVDRDMPPRSRSLPDADRGTMERWFAEGTR